MKRYYLTFLLLLTVIFLSGCSDDNVQKDEYDVTFEVSKTTVKEVGGSFEITAKLHVAADQDIAFSFTSIGDATLGEDFIVSDNLLTIPSGEMSSSIIVDIVNDFIFEGEEAIELRASDTFDYLTDNTKIQVIHVLIEDGIEVRGNASFDRHAEKALYMQDSDYEIFSLNMNTLALRKYTFSNPVYSPKLSADGKSFYYLQLSSEGYFSQLWSYDLEDNVKTKVSDASHGNILNFSLDEESSYISFVGYSSDRSTESIYVKPLQEQGDTYELAGTPKGRKNFSPVFFTGTKILGFSDSSHIYLYNLVSSTLATIDIDANIHYMNEDGLFTSFKDSYYQIFKLNTKDNSIEQVTFSNSHKLKPSLGEQGNLAYIDAGSMLDAKHMSWMRWNDLMNSTSTYKDYTNHWGRVSWYESSVLEFLYNAASEFSDNHIEHVYANHVQSVLNTMDQRSGISDYQGVSTCGWSANRYSLDKTSLQRISVLDSMVGTELAKFLKLVSGKESKSEEMIALEQDVDSAVACIIDETKKHWITSENDPLGIALEDEAYLRLPFASPQNYDGINVPFNFQNKFGSLLLNYSEYSSDSDLARDARMLANVFIRHMEKLDSGYAWNYWWGTGFHGWNSEDGYSLNTPSSPGTKSRASSGYAGIDLAFFSHFIGVHEGLDLELLLKTYKQGKTMDLDPLSVGLLLEEFDSSIRESLKNQKALLDIELRYVPLLDDILSTPQEDWKVVFDFGEAEPMTSSVDHPIYQFKRKNNNLVFISKSDGESYKLNSIVID